MACVYIFCTSVFFVKDLLDMFCFVECMYENIKSQQISASVCTNDCTIMIKCMCITSYLLFFMNDCLQYTFFEMKVFPAQDFNNLSNKDMVYLCYLSWVFFHSVPCKRTDLLCKPMHVLFSFSKYFVIEIILQQKERNKFQSKIYTRSSLSLCLSGAGCMAGGTDQWHTNTRKQQTFRVRYRGVLESTIHTNPACLCFRDNLVFSSGGGLH